MAPRRGRILKETIKAEVRGDNAADIASVYDAPFPIYSEEEGERYRELRSKTIEVPTYFNFEVLDQIGLTDIFMTLCRRGKWEYFVRINYPVYRELTLEFFTSLRFVKSKPKKFWFRLRGQVCYMDERVLWAFFGFAIHDIDDGHQSFTISSYWKYLTDLDEYDAHIASNAQIIHAELKLLHKFMCGVVFGKRQSTKCSRKELFLLWCIDHGHKPNMFAYVSRTLIEIAGRKWNSLGMGYLVTGLDENFRIDLSDLDMLSSHYFYVPYLKRCEIIDDKTMQLRDPSTRTTLKRRLAASESSSRCNVVGYFSESEWQGQHPQQQQLLQQVAEQEPQPDLGMIYKLMVDNHRSTQQQLDEIKERLNSLDQRVDSLTQEVRDIDADVQYVERKLEKA